MNPSNNKNLNINVEGPSDNSIEGPNQLKSPGKIAILQ